MLEDKIFVFYAASLKITEKSHIHHKYNFKNVTNGFIFGSENV